MKNKIHFTFLCLLGCGLLPLLTGCYKNPTTRTYAIYSPVYADKTTVMASINGPAGQPVDSAGKIYVKDKFIFLNELNKGIHIYDNTDPVHPVQTAYLSIPGNQDIAVKGNTLYADMYQDLLAIDISDPRHVKITAKVPALFLARGYVNGYFTNSDEKVITGWTARDTTVPIDPVGRPGRNSGLCSSCPIFYDALSVAASASSYSATGTAGSMAAMVLINDYLYAITESHSLSIISVANASSPSKLSSMTAGFNLETIYPFKDQLFLGSSQGIYIYDLSNPAKPVSKGQFSHSRACDPVIADGDYAYVTLHAGTPCGGASNELDVINVQNPAQSQLLRTYPMTSPMGLSKDGDLLFVCDGKLGVKVYNAKDPANLQLLTVTGGGKAYDVIASQQHLLVVATDGLYQYDYSSPSDIHLLSFLPAK